MPVSYELNLNKITISLNGGKSISISFESKKYFNKAAI